jgi:group I intron endonuclease
LFLLVFCFGIQNELLGVLTFGIRMIFVNYLLNRVFLKFQEMFDLTKSGKGAILIMGVSMHVYKITNIVNDKIYVGQHGGDDLQAYLALNCGRALGGSRQNDKPLLYRAIRKYGREAFSIESLVRPIDKDQTNKLEKFFIRTLEAQNPEIGYNLTEGGTGGATRFGPHAPEAIEKMHLAQMGKPKSPEHRKNLSVARTGVPNPKMEAIWAQRPRNENPSPAAIRNRRYRANKKQKRESGV